MIDVNTETLKAIMPGVPGAKGVRQGQIVATVGPLLHDTLARYEINTPLRVAHFLAQIMHESDGFCTTEEYASGSRYEGRRDLGNTQTGDGVRYKGRGLIQLTGRANYDTYGKRIGADLINNPTHAADPATSLVLACEYWKATRGGLSRFADADDIVSITKAINGGLNGLDDRKKYLAKAKASLGGTGPAIGGGTGARGVLRRGDRGDQVTALQTQLGKAGFATGTDGDFGPGTETQVRAFQTARGLTADGVVGPGTWAALDAAAPAQAAPQPAAT